MPFLIILDESLDASKTFNWKFIKIMHDLPPFIIIKRQANHSKFQVYLESKVFNRFLLCDYSFIKEILLSFYVCSSHLVEAKHHHY